MKLGLKIGLLFLLGNIIVEGYPKINHRRRGSSHDRQDSILTNLGRNGPFRHYNPRGNTGHHHFYRRHHYRMEDLKRQRYYSEESSEWNSGSLSELDDDSSEYNYGDEPEYRPCLGSRCPHRDTIDSWIRPSTTTINTSKAFDAETRNPTSGPSKSVPLISEPVTSSLLNPETTELISELVMSRNIEKENEKEVSENVTTDNPDINPTTMSSPEVTTVSQAILDCIDKCIPTSEFNPVCGTNGETYSNIGRLFCAKSCGVNVEFRRHSSCTPILPFLDDYEDYDGNTNSDDRNDTQLDMEGREGSGNVVNDERVDAYDNISNSFDRVETSSQSDGVPLAPSSHVDIEETPPLQLPGSKTVNLLSPSSTSQPPRDESESADDEMSFPPTDNDNAVFTTISFLSSSTTNAPRFRRTTRLTELQTCMQLCPLSTSYNPVCGTDLVTYINIERVECARACGLDVKIASFGPCQPDVRTETPIVTIERTAEEVTISPAILQCIKRCVVTSEYNPVCGTNEETYTNPGKLECARYCGIDVKLNYQGLCNGFYFSVFTRPLDNKTSSGGQTKKVSTFLPLIPVITSKSTVSSSNTPLKNDPASIITTTESPNSTNFTLAPNILKSIFGESENVTTTEMTRQRNESILDPRFGNESREDADFKKVLDPNRIVFPD